MQDQLHASGLVEEALDDERRLRGHDAEHAATVGEIVNRLLRPLATQAALLHQPVEGLVPWLPELRIDPGA